MTPNTNTADGFVSPTSAALPIPSAPCSSKTQESYQAFLLALPTLLESHAGQWVAFSGNDLLGIGDSRRLLYQKVLAAGYPLGEFLVCSIEPPQEVILDNLFEN